MPKGATDVRILIAEDSRLFREGLRNLFEAQPGLLVVGEAADGLDILCLVDQLKPDILLLNPRIPNISIMDTLLSLSQLPKSPHTIVLAGDSDSSGVAEAFRVGARGVIPEEASFASLLECIRAVAAGLYWVMNEAVADCPRLEKSRTNSRAKANDLTRRELEILAAVISGKTNRAIAEQFSISEQTVKHHVSNIFDKLGVYNRLELSVFTVRNQLKAGLPAGIGRTREKTLV
jgi:DNA-binding NarL/FixJ family response regulator